MFCGVFNGNGHTITLNIDSTKDCQGLIGMVGARAIIRNVVDGTIKGNDYIGSIVGASSGSGTILFENCWNKATITATGINAAGILGCNWGSYTRVTLKNCYNTSTISGCSQSGAISGWLGSGANVINCYNAGTISGYQSGRTFARYSIQIVIN